MSDAMLAIMRGPDRDVFNANVPRLVVQDDGVIEVSYERGNALYNDTIPAGPVAKL